MLGLRAVYDGQKLKFKEPIEITTPCDVVVTFLDQPEVSALDFLKDEEDLYSDDDLKEKY